MAELEKTIKALQSCSVQNDVGCQLCPYFEDRKTYGHEWCTTVMAQDALELLKKQVPKPVWYETNSMTGLPISHCPSCNEIIKQYAYGDIRKHTIYCQYCGQAVKWE